MNFKSLILLYILVFITTLVLTILGSSLWLIMLIVFVSILGPFIFLQIHTAYWSNDLKKVEKFLQANSKKPLLAFTLSLAHGNRTEVEENLHDILAKYKQPLIQQVYSTNLHLLHRDYEAACASANRISKDSLRSYYLAYVAAKKGDIDEAKSYRESFDKPWMKHTMNSFIALHEGNRTLAELEHQKAIDTSRGIQKYSVVHSHNHL